MTHQEGCVEEEDQELEQRTLSSVHFDETRNQKASRILSTAKPQLLTDSRKYRECVGWRLVYRWVLTKRTKTKNYSLLLKTVDDETSDEDAVCIQSTVMRRRIVTFTVELEDVMYTFPFVLFYDFQMLLSLHHHSSLQARDDWVHDGVHKWLRVCCVVFIFHIKLLMIVNKSFSFWTNKRIIKA